MSAEYKILVRDKRLRKDFDGGSLFEIMNEAGKPAISEIYLKKGLSFELNFSSGNYLILPVHGELTIETEKKEQTVFPSQLIVNTSGGPVTIHSDKEEELSRFYLFVFKNSAAGNFSGEYAAEIKNELQQLLDENYRLHIGIFDGRKEESHRMAKTDAIVICVNGAFEFQNRLIETCDSLLIRNDSLLEMEALSENAILLILEYNC